VGRIIAVANQKGGVGKTTTAINLGAALAFLGKKVLLIDSDPQGNTTSGLGVADKDNLEQTFYELLLGECYIEEAMRTTNVPNLKLLPSNVHLAGAEIDLLGYDDREYLLKNILSNVNYLYDFIIIDCPPSLNMLTINALTAANSVLVPIQCEFYAMEGLSQLLHTIGLIQRGLNRNLEIEGIVFTMYDSRTNLSMEVVEEVKNHLNSTDKYKGINIYKSIIPRNVRLSEAPSHDLTIMEYDPKSKGATAYEDLAKEVIKKHQKK